MSDAKILVTKAAAACRQINAAIQMHFLDLDNLAIHTVAGAASRLVHDLHEKRGANAHETAFKVGLIRAINNYLESKPIPEELHDFVSEMVGKMDESEKNFFRTIKDTDPSKIQLSGFNTKQFWDHSVKAVNFLKHANRDPKGVLDEAAINNIHKILECVGPFVDLGFPASPEMKVFYYYLCSRNIKLAADAPLSDAEFKTIEQLNDLDESDRKAACLDLISHLKDWKRKGE